MTLAVIAKLQEKEDLGEKADQVITAIDSDISAVPGANTTEVKNILISLLQRQRKIIRLLKFIVTGT
jgi:hypothetical protein